MKPKPTLWRYLKEISVGGASAPRSIGIARQSSGRKGLSRITKNGLAFPVLVFLASFVLIVNYSSPLTKNTASKPSGASLPEAPASEENGSSDLPATDRVNPPVSRELSPTRSLSYQTPKRVSDFDEADRPTEGEVIDAQASTPVGFVDPPFPEELSEEQVNELSFIREQFVTLLGGVNQDPTDPTYLARWATAQRQVDEEFMSFFGEDAFNQQQLKAIAGPE